MENSRNSKYHVLRHFTYDPGIYMSAYQAIYLIGFRNLNT